MAARGIDINFPGLLGQERICRQLAMEIKNQRMAHAYLLVGPKGSGRAHLALNLFMALNCENRLTGASPCLNCASCLRAARQQHENLIILAPPHDQASAQIKVEDLREALRATCFPPLNNGVRLIFIREAEQLNQASANALLKTLEEPPAHNLIILSVQETAGLLPTLVSRCRKLNLQPLASDIMLKVLEERACSQPRARIALSGGALGQALELDPELLQSTLEYLLAQLDDKNSLSDWWSLSEELTSRFRGKERIDRQGLVGLLGLLAQFYRDQAISSAGRRKLALLSDIKAQKVPLKQALYNFNQVRKCQNQLLGNAQPELALTVLLNRLANAPQDIN